MSKRVANAKPRNRKARNGRVRLGFHKRRLLNQLDEMDKAQRAGKIGEDLEQKFAEIRQRAKQMLPARFLRRSQER